MNKFERFLLDHKACEPAYDFCKSLNFDFTTCFQMCPELSWKIWSAGKSKIELNTLIQLVIDLAETVAFLNPDQRGCNAIKAAKECFKNPTLKNINNAVKSARAAKAAQAGQRSKATMVASASAWMLIHQTESVEIIEERSINTARLAGKWAASAAKENPELTAKLNKIVDDAVYPFLKAKFNEDGTV